MRRYAWALMLLCSGCTYHLVGQGRGVIPEQVQTVALHATSAGALSMQSKLLHYFEKRSHDYQWVKMNGQAQMQFLKFEEKFVPVAYDVTGIATSYRLSLSGSLELWYEEQAIWRSGHVQVQDDVFILDGPASVDASRQRVRETLEQQWMLEVWLRISSGF